MNPSNILQLVELANQVNCWDDCDCKYSNSIVGWFYKPTNITRGHRKKKPFVTSCIGWSNSMMCR